MGPQRIRMGIFGGALALGLVLLLLVFRPHVAPLRPAIAALKNEGRVMAGSPSEAATAASAPSLEGRSRLVEGLNSPQGDIHADLRMLNALFIAYRGATHQGNPVGENNEITAVLRGKNRLGYEFIPRDCTAVNARGELCDRWGTPFFFHQLSGERMEIRSAGPDHRLWTEDDQVLTP
jgi:hypothetical protein